MVKDSYNFTNVLFEIKVTWYHLQNDEKRQQKNNKIGHGVGNFSTNLLFVLLGTSCLYQEQ